MFPKTKDSTVGGSSSTTADPFGTPTSTVPQPPAGGFNFTNAVASAPPTTFVMPTSQPTTPGSSYVLAWHHLDNHPTTPFANKTNGPGQPTGANSFASFTSTPIAQPNDTANGNFFAPCGFPNAQPTSVNPFTTFAPTPIAQSNDTENGNVFASRGLPKFQTTGTNIAGTPVKFHAVVGHDIMVKNGQSTDINAVMHCITCMAEYENKSQEELRLEDLAANRKAPFATSTFVMNPNGWPSNNLANAPVNPFAQFPNKFNPTAHCWTNHKIINTNYPVPSLPGKSSTLFPGLRPAPTFNQMATSFVPPKAPTTTQQGFAVVCPPSERQGLSRQPVSHNKKPWFESPLKIGPIQTKTGIQSVDNTATVQDGSFQPAQKLPPFVKGCAKFWFMQIEAIFRLAHIDQSMEKYLNVIANLDLSILQIIAYKLQRYDYDELKDLLIKLPTDDNNVEAAKDTESVVKAELLEQRLTALEKRMDNLTEDTAKKITTESKSMPNADANAVEQCETPLEEQIQNFIGDNTLEDHITTFQNKLKIDMATNKINGCSLKDNKEVNGLQAGPSRIHLMINKPAIQKNVAVMLQKLPLKRVTQQKGAKHVLTSNELKASYQNYVAPSAGSHEVDAAKSPATPVKILLDDPAWKFTAPKCVVEKTSNDTTQENEYMVQPKLVNLAGEWEKVWKSREKVWKSQCKPTAPEELPTTNADADSHEEFVKIYEENMKSYNDLERKEKRFYTIERKLKNLEGQLKKTAKQTSLEQSTMTLKNEIDKLANTVATVENYVADMEKQIVELLFPEGE